jgi:PAS domain S-box-containing protein
MNTAEPSLPENEQGPTVLAVDDDPASLGILSEYLQHSGFRVIVARDGESALEKARHGKPDLILLDLLMPKMDGFETCRRLKADETSRDIPVIFLTAMTGLADKVEAFWTGGVDYITKPFQQVEVLARVKTHLSLYAMQKQLAAQNVQLKQEMEEHRRAEEALREERNLFISGPTVIFKWKSQEGWPVEYVSSNVLSQYGYKPEDFMSGRILYGTIVHPDDLPRVAAEVKAYAEAKTPCFEQEYRIARADGEYRWLFDFTMVVRDFRGVVTHYHGYVQDISERKRVEEALRKAYEELEHRVKEPTAELRSINERLKAEVAERKRAEEALRKAHDELESRVRERRAQLEAASKDTEKLEIDRRVEEGGAMNNQSDSPAVAEGHPPSILVVDDDPANLSVMSDYLKDLGFHVTVARDGESALEKARYGRPDLILLDLLMPKIDGFETCRRLKIDDTLKNIPVIFMTALTETQDKVKGFQVGGVDYITKPFQHAEVLARIKIHLTLRAMQKQLETQNAHLQHEILERERAEEALREAHNEMEQRVKDRTAALSQANRMLGILNACNQIVMRATDEMSLLREICYMVVEVGGYPLAWIGLAEQDAAKTVRPVAHAGLENGYLSALRITTWADTEQGGGPTGTAIRSNQPTIVNDVRTDPSFTSWKEEAVRLGYASMIALPLCVDNQVVGTLSIYAAEPNAFHSREVNMLIELTGNLAFGMMSLRLQVKHKKTEQAGR